ncbi:transporter, major facilitator family protein [Neobacillus bataviensis LMG 21833]|uniref:Transporter, major facilitator family protein n=1 Tax=Neobacillus bataviensis LMG 21833 TaxID=1117379 RepID=K6D6T1_9BACI|nr:MFS transporter [Neobacillus bataviensis]EKN63773.1 transporter, major facilitator family protein [Neobacillus bataviensis LMG 21833]
MSNQTQAHAPTMRSLFANRFVQSILLSGLFLQLGIWVRNFAILLFVTEQTNKDPFAISMISVAEFGPIFLFSFIGGTFADRWRPKLTMVLCDVLSALSIFVVLLALIYGGWEAIFFATLVSSILSQFSQPSGMKLFKLHVPDSLMQLGMSMNQMIQAIFMILGPMIGTLVYFRFGINVAIALMGACFLLSAVVLTFLPPDQKIESSPAANLPQEMKMGLRYVFSNKIFILMGGFFLAAGMGLGLVNPLGIFLVTEHLGLTPQNLQWFTAVNGVGMILGGVVAMGISKKISSQSMLLTGFILSAVSVSTMGSVKLIWLALCAQFISGMMVPLIHIACNTLILSNADDAFVGRVNGILNPLFMGGMVLNMSLVGVLKGQFSLSTLYMIASGLFIIGALVMLPLLRIKKGNQIKIGEMQHH